MATFRIVRRRRRRDTSLATRINLGDGYRGTFERLLLPFSSDGIVVDHIVGAVVIEREAVGER